MSNKNDFTYAGRLTLVQSVLSTLHSYWSSIFLIPNGIIKRINSICSNFLWGGKAEYVKVPNFSWDTCCTPKLEGGLGIKHLKTWNIALLGKYVWWLAQKKDHLWVRWIHHVYMKDTHWTDDSPPSDCSWSWRKITQVMEKFQQAYTNDCWLNSSRSYTVKLGYDWLRVIHPKVPWFHLCWNALNIPKSAFIFWSAMHKKLLTKDRLSRMSLTVNLECEICGLLPEDLQHLFSDCVYMKQCFQALQVALKIRLPSSNVIDWFSKCRKVTKLQKRFMGACYVDLIYKVWLVRNEARLNGLVKQPKSVIHQLIQEVKLRMLRMNVSTMKQGDSNWLNQIAS